VVADPPPGRGRLIVSLFIVGWLLWQLTVPLSYYVSNYVTGQVQEEQRFSWRMFSQVWFLQRWCNVLAFEIEAPTIGPDPPAVRRLDLRRLLHPIWIAQMRENRRPVVEKFLQSRCQGDPSVVAAEYMRTCPVAAGWRLPEVNRRVTCRPGVPTASFLSP
jgi:hypothetical protein